MISNELRIVTSFPHTVAEYENEWIELADGCRLAARMWRPTDTTPVPAILEYLPYRKRDGTAPRDELTHPYFAGHGYACVRVDMRGNGESEGLMHDEYARQEQEDALEIIAWLAEQPWCNGNVGMIGISWGGFNGLQVAARKPPALKAVITLCSTDDRYADDVHYKGGALLMENLGWASTMLAYSSRPPDPALVGDRWREMWMDRLDNTPLLVETWLSHPYRDDYWRHGSVCENFAAIDAAVFAVGGWGDAYSNAIPRLVNGVQAPVKGLIGPWVHKYPHFAVPRPAIGFLQEALRWWNHWLKNEPDDIVDEPAIRAYVMDAARPQGAYEERGGRWIGESAWPSAAINVQSWALNHDGLGHDPTPETPLIVSSPQHTGTACGEYCAMWLGPEWPIDQRLDDAYSLTFDTPLLPDSIDIVGAPAVDLEVSCDRPQANLAVRLCDIWPDGASTRISYGILNLTHRDSHAEPAPLQPGKRYRIRIALDDIAYAVPAGHQLRIAISTAYWPMIWPSPATATITLYSGTSSLDLPVRNTSRPPPAPFSAPECSTPMRRTVLRESEHRRSTTQDAATGLTEVTIVDDFGRFKNDAHGLVTDEVARETHRIDPVDPLSCRSEIHWTEQLERGEWQVRIETRTTMWSDRENFYIQAELEAFEGDTKTFTRSWDRRLRRNLV
ncbi:MAG: CocE/NonD family hydrolase [Gammaproteobacteria bacterium]|nr:CocE/NonD family hydrolase [Gammaproteobacteria bacterium]MDH3464454.1 CocE/NonD family hydrolase [Gammaproteobacteria bacterium]